jgi:hypothetical protein
MRLRRASLALLPTRVIAAASMLMSLSTGLSAQTTGIAACDDFLTKYETCVATKVPGAQRTMFQGQFDQMRKAWSDAAKNPGAKAGLEGACKQAAEQVKIAMSGFGCAF